MIFVTNDNLLKNPLKFLNKTSVGFGDDMEERWVRLSVAGCPSMDQLVLAYSL